MNLERELSGIVLQPTSFVPLASAMDMRVLVLSSGGKDSCYAVWWATLRGWEVVGIVTVRVAGDDSLMFQIPTTEIAAIQASAAGIPWLPVSVSGDEEKEMQELQEVLALYIEGDGVAGCTSQSHSDVTPLIEGEEPGSRSDNLRESRETIFGNQIHTTPSVLHTTCTIDALVCGALRSDYQKTRIERMAENLGIHSYTPLWHKSPSQHMRELIENGFTLKMTSVSADGLDEKWVGRVIDSNSLDELFSLAERYRFSCDGEGGEFETTVISAPWFNGTIHIEGEVSWDGRRGEMVVNSAYLAD